MVLCSDRFNASNGHPIVVLMADRQTTGGYTKTVLSLLLPIPRRQPATSGDGVNFNITVSMTAQDIRAYIISSALNY